MIELVNPFVLISTLVALLSAFAVQRYIAKRAAATSFRESVIERLAGFYPAPGSWSMGFEPRLCTAIAQIEVSVQKFRYFVARRKRTSYDAAWASLKLYSSELTWEKCAGYKMYPSMRVPDEKDPRAAFYERLENLLRYAHET